jgi:phosphopentomutase
VLNDFAADIAPIWGATRMDAPTMLGAIECLKRERPRVLYVLLGETDEWGHERRYDLYLDALWRSDRFVKRLWEAAQSMPEYRGTTALLVAVDHGRGATVGDWTDHGRKVPAAEQVWMAAMGPGIAQMGVREGTAVTLSQVAATIAAVVGEDFRAASADAAAPLPLRSADSRR